MTELRDIQTKFLIQLAETNNLFLDKVKKATEDIDEEQDKGKYATPLQMLHHIIVEMDNYFINMLEIILNLKEDTIKDIENGKNPFSEQFSKEYSKRIENVIKEIERLKEEKEEKK